MKKSTRIAIMTSITMIFLGIVLFTFGIFKGGLTSVALKGISVGTNGIYYTGASGKYKKIEKKLKPFEKITVDTNQKDIKIVEGDEFFIKLYGYEKSDYTNKDGHLKVNTLESKRINLFNWGSGHKEEYIEITVPKETPLKRIETKTSSGEIYLIDLESKEVSASSDSGEIYLVDNLISMASLKTFSGEVQAEGNFTDILKINSSSGSVNGEIQEDISKELSINTSSGEITLDANSIGDLKLRTNSGEISGTISGDIAGKANAKSNSGNIDLEGKSAEDIVIETSSGEIYGKFEGDVKNIDAESVSGNLEMSGISSGNISLKTTSGEIYGKFKGSINSYIIDADSISGDLEINRKNAKNFNSNEKTSEEKPYKFNIKTTSGDADITMK